MGKAAFYDLKGTSEEAAYDRAVEVMTENALRGDAQEGIAAFLEKRRPKWVDS
jgi:enoyl-CoA hydratase/carnithine racemase